MTDYSKWSKYDADGEEQRVEVEAFKEAAAAKDLTTQATTKQLEGEGVHVVSDMAAKAEAHARVAALRAQGGGRRRIRGSTAPGGATPSASGANVKAPSSVLKASAAAASELALQAAALQGLQGELEALVRERDAAQALLNVENDESSSSSNSSSTGTKLGDHVAALVAFQGCLQHVAAVEQLLPPELNDDDDENPADSTSSSGSPSGDDAARGAVNAVRRTVGMVRQDTLRGLGLAQLATPGASLLAEASESLKACLLQDGSDVEAWLGRGEAFARMGLLALAELHWDQVAELLAVDKKSSTGTTPSPSKPGGDKSTEKTANSNAQQPTLLPERSGRAAAQWARLEAYRRCTTWPLAVPPLATSSRYDSSRDDAFRPSAASESGSSLPATAAAAAVPPAPADTGPQAAAALVESANVLAKEGLVILKERFFRTAAAKFVAALVRLDTAHRLATAAANTNTTTTTASTTPEVGNSSNTSSGDNSSNSTSNGNPLVRSSGIASGPSGEAPALQRLRATCHTNAAACLLIRQRDFDEASAHCGAALTCSQLGRACLHRAATIASSSTSSNSPGPESNNNHSGSSSNNESINALDQTVSATAATAASDDNNDITALMTAATAATSENRGLCVTALSRQAEALTQLGRFRDAAARLQTAIELAQGKSGVPQQRTSSIGRSVEGTDDSSAKIIDTLVARRARILYLETQFSELDQDSGATATHEATEEEIKDIANSN